MPINIQKLIKYWNDGALEDIDTAKMLMKSGKGKEALFFPHLAMEKALKALVVKAIKMSLLLPTTYRFWQEVQIFKSRKI